MAYIYTQGHYDDFWKSIQKEITGIEELIDVLRGVLPTLIKFGNLTSYLENKTVVENTWLAIKKVSLKSKEVVKQGFDAMIFWDQDAAIFKEFMEEVIYIGNDFDRIEKRAQRYMTDDSTFGRKLPELEAKYEAMKFQIDAITSRYELTAEHYDQRLEPFRHLGPSEFSFKGFKIQNPFRLDDRRIKETLQGINEGVERCKAKGVNPNEFVDIIRIRPPVKGETELGWAFMGRRIMELVVNKDKQHVAYIFIHEVGHLLDINMSPVARDFFHEPWTKADKHEIIKIKSETKKKFVSEMILAQGDLNIIKKKFNATETKAIYEWLKQDGSVDKSFVTPKNFAWWFRAKDKILPTLKKLNNPEIHAQLVLEFKGDGTAFQAKVQQEFLNRGFGLSPAYYEYSKLSDLLYQFWDLNLNRDEVIKDVDKAKKDINDLGIPTDYGKTNKLEDWAESFTFYVLHPERLSENALFRIKRTLWLTQENNRRVIDRIARAKKRVK